MSKTVHSIIRLLLAVIFITGILLTGLFSTSCGEDEYSGKIESLTIGRPTSDSGLPIFTADQMGFFARNGIELVQKDYATGLASINALLNNEIDLAGMGEVPFVTKATDGANVSTIGVYARSFNTYVIVRTDKGITNMSDLRGKRIGLPLNTIPHFYLNRLLELNGIGLEEVTLVNLTPTQTVAAIADGTVDAVVVWDPYVSQIEEQLEGITVKWLAHNNQAQYSVLAACTDWIKDNPELVKRFVKALSQAIDYIDKHQTEAKEILQNRYNYDAAYVEKVWPQYQFGLFLDQSFILAMEDESRWMVSSNLTTGKQVPNFLDYIYSDGLKSVKPDAVKIVGR